MEITNTKGGLRDVLERISGMCSKAESSLNLCRDGFVKNDDAREGKFCDSQRRDSIEDVAE